jgi:hypothetical protein
MRHCPGTCLERQRKTRNKSCQIWTKGRPKTKQGASYTITTFGWEDVENVLRELKLERWRQKANNIEQWAFVDSKLCQVDSISGCKHRRLYNPYFTWTWNWKLSDSSQTARHANRLTHNIKRNLISLMFTTFVTYILYQYNGYSSSRLIGHWPTWVINTQNRAQ